MFMAVILLVFLTCVLKFKLKNICKQKLKTKMYKVQNTCQ